MPLINTNNDEDHYEKLVGRQAEADQYYYNCRNYILFQ